VARSKRARKGRASCRRRALAGGARHRGEGGIGVAQRQRRLGCGRAAQRRQRRPADADAALACFARQPGDGDLDLVAVGAAQKVGDRVALGEPARRCGGARRGVDEGGQGSRHRRIFRDGDRAPSTAPPARHLSPASGAPLLAQGRHAQETDAAQPQARPADAQPQAAVPQPQPGPQRQARTAAGAPFGAAAAVQPQRQSAPGQSAQRQAVAGWAFVMAISW
jgi:hypothetical protein